MIQCIAFYCTQSAFRCIFCSYVLVLEAGGGELAVAATAAALALADAGIEMFDLVTACSVVSA